MRNYNGVTNEEQDVLRARFTIWLDTVLRNAKINYIRSQTHIIETVSIDDILQFHAGEEADPYVIAEKKDREFYIQEERLAKAFTELPLMRREVLRLLFVEERTPREIAEILQCSENYVYLQKSRALRRLREQLGRNDK